MTHLADLAGASKYTLGDLQTRLATFFSLNKTDTQVLAVINECIQTGYEKVVAMANQHAKQVELSITTEVGEKEYANNNMGIPTYVGYKAGRLTYLPYEVLREKYQNFSTESDATWDEGDPQYYSLVGFNGSTKGITVIPTPKEVGTLYVLCFKTPAPLTALTDYPAVPADWAWLVLERAKIERLRFEEKNDLYVTQAQEFVAYVKVMLNRIYPAAPEPESGFIQPPDRIAYNRFRGSR